MIKIFLIFSFIFFIKSTFLTLFYTNYLTFLLYPLEIAGLSLYNKNLNNDLTFNDKHNTYLRWFIINWIGYDDDYELLNNFEKEKISNIIIFLSWILAFILYQLFYLIYIKIKKQHINKVSFLIHNLKYLLTNYMSLYLWNLNTLLNLNYIYFWYGFISVLILNFILFWFPGIIFNFIYGEKLYLYREKYNFLLDNFNLKYKYSVIILLFLKFLVGIYVFLFKYWNIGSKFILFNILLFYNLIIYYNNIFIGKIKKPIYYLSLISSIIILLSILEDYFSSFEIIIFKYISVITYLLLLVKFYRNFHIKNNNDSNNIVI